MLYKSRLPLFKIESVYDTDPTPDNSNTILTTGAVMQHYGGELVTLDYDKVALGAKEQINTNPQNGIQFGVMAAGAIAAGKPPGYDCLFRACGLDPTPTEEENDQAQGPGASTDTIELAAGSSAVDDYYNNMWIVLDGGTGSGQSKRIIDYTGSSTEAQVESDWSTAPDATTTYIIYSDVTYAPVSSGFESVTGYYLLDTGVQQHKSTGMRGNVGLTLARGQFAAWNFDNFIGAYYTPATVSQITPDYSLFTDPVAVTKDNTGTVTIDSYAACLESLNFTLGNTVVRQNKPNCQETLITDRNLTGTIVIGAPTLATKNFFSKLESHQTISKIPIAITHGVTVGNTISLSLPTVQLTGISETDLDGQLGYSMTFSGIPSSSGNDEISIVIQ